MKITILTVGRLKEHYWVDACGEYLKRLGPYAKIAIREIADRDPARFGGVEEARHREGIDLLSALPEKSHMILLAIDGTERSSEDISHRLDELTLRGCSDIVFVVGGSTGVDDAVRVRADETLSFGPITLPHNLARVVMLEQLYRAFRISRGEPYHK